MFSTIAQVKTANKAIDHHWFDRGALRFFDSRIESTLYAGRYFITSEQFHGSTGSAPRTYSIRSVNDDGSIDTVGKFNEMFTIEDARDAVRRLLKFEKALLTHSTCPTVNGTDLVLWEWLQKRSAGSYAEGKNL